MSPFEWISVNDRMPEPNVYVLLWEGSGNRMSVKRYVPSDGVHCWGWYPDGLPIWTARHHWMPLPPPPQAGGHARRVVTVADNAAATEEVAAKRKVSMSINDSAGAKDPKL